MRGKLKVDYTIILETKYSKKMKNKFSFILAGLAVAVVLGLVGIALVSQAASQPFTPSKAEVMARKIIVFKSGILNEPDREALVKKHGGVITKNLDLIEGKAVLLPPKVEAALAREAGVLRIDDDVEVFALAKPIKVTQPAEVLPWGVDRIDAEKVWGGSEDATAVIPGNPSGQGVKVAIVDTGIDVKHSDLKDNLKGGVSTVAYTRKYNDDNGHGTHVAGIAAAVDNEIGVIGVGPEIYLYAVKVLDRRGSGWLSDVIEGLDWVITQKNTQGGDWVVNMSLGTTSYNKSFEEAVKKVNAAGITQVAAAGNNGPDDNTVTYPAKFAEVIAVTATNDTDTIASWSSRGSEVDLAAPGVSIYSTYKGSTYKTLDGTSMASPHVAGTAALVLTQTTKCDSDLNGICSPAEVQQRLEATAEDLGAVGRDDLYGSGLVDAEKAVQ